DRMLQKFSARLPSDLKNLEQAVAAENWIAAAAQAHALKGMAANLAALPLKTAAAALEAACRAAEQKDAVEAFKAAASESQRCLNDIALYQSNIQPNWLQPVENSAKLEPRT